MLSKIKLRHVHYIPKDLESGILYVARDFDAVAHLCPCGCGSKIRTPLGPTEWFLEETAAGPTLTPSIGNWQQTCQSHYWIHEGKIIWSSQWAHEEIVAGRRLEEERRFAYYDALSDDSKTIFKRLWRRLKDFFN